MSGTIQDLRLEQLKACLQKVKTYFVGQKINK